MKLCRIRALGLTAALLLAALGQASPARAADEVVYQSLSPKDVMEILLRFRISSKSHRQVHLAASEVNAMAHGPLAPSHAPPLWRASRATFRNASLSQNNLSQPGQKRTTLGSTGISESVLR